MLTQVADELKACPDARVEVVGHTDDSGDDAINMPLSADRAKTVADSLVSQGVAGDHVTSRGVGAAEPVASNATPEGRAQNRRVAITVVS
jgi:peptidoglycan-binding protein ArfA